MGGGRVIIRVKHAGQFTVTRNQTVRDSRLSFRATGVLIYLLSLTDDATTDAEALSKVKKEGEKAVRTALRELETAGYLTRERKQIERGRWVTEVTIRERPESPQDSPAAGYRRSVHGRPENRRSKGRSTKESAAVSRAAAAPSGRCSVCVEKATLATLGGTWLCDYHFHLNAKHADPWAAS